MSSAGPKSAPPPAAIVASRAGENLTTEIDEMLATRVYSLASVDGRLTRQVDSLNSIIMLILKKYHYSIVGDNCDY
jgi:hypothetical protein